MKPAAPPSFRKKRIAAACAGGFLVTLALTLWLVQGSCLQPSPLGMRLVYVASWRSARGVPFNQPYAIAVSPRNGDVLVTDAQNQRLVIFRPSGRVRRIFDLSTGPDKIAIPSGVAVGPQGKMYVSDFINDHVCVFSAQGRFLDRWGNSGSGPGQFDSPGGAAVAANGDSYVPDFYHHRIEVFNAKRRFIRQIGTNWHWRPLRIWPGNFNYPTDVAMMGKNILVADAYSYRIQLLTPEGRPLRAWGYRLLRFWPRPGTSNCGFAEPTGVAFNANNHLIAVADGGNHRVVILDSRGRYLTDWVLHHTNKHVNTPTQMAWSPGGHRLYATDIANHRVVVLRLERGAAGS